MFYKEKIVTYVDDARLPYGRMLMSHLMADSRAELDEAADRIGVAHRWIQKVGTYAEHYDVCQSKRALAVRAGAIEVSQKELGKILRDRRLREKRRKS